MRWKGVDKVIKEPCVIAIRIFDFDVNHVTKNSSINQWKRKMKKYWVARLTFFSNHGECVLLSDGDKVIHQILVATTDKVGIRCQAFSTKRIISNNRFFFEMFVIYLRHRYVPTAH